MNNYLYWNWINFTISQIVFFIFFVIFVFSGFALFKFAVTCHLSVLKFVHNCALHRIAYFFLRSFINFLLIYAYCVRHPGGRGEKLGKRNAATRKMLESRVLVDCDTINSHKYYSSAVATPPLTRSVSGNTPKTRIYAYECRREGAWLLI